MKVVHERWTSYFMQLDSKIDDIHVAEGTLDIHRVTRQESYKLIDCSTGVMKKLFSWFRNSLYASKPRKLLTVWSWMIIQFHSAMLQKTEGQLKLSPEMCQLWQLWHMDTCEALIYVLSCIHFCWQQILNAKCGKYFVKIFIIFVLSRIRKNLLVPNHLLTWEKTNFSTV